MPVGKPIEYILDRIYRNKNTPDLEIPGVSMGNPIGVLFANFNMGTIEENKPHIYGHYVDDIFVCIKKIYRNCKHFNTV